MEKDRLLAFSDGVIAIIITTMVLELRPPHEPTLEALRALAPSPCVPTALQSGITGLSRPQRGERW